jgi:hypothetical protein
MASVVTRALGIACLAIALAAGCTKQPQSRWARPDVGVETTREVELDCHQRAIEAFEPGNNPTDAQAVHVRREEYFARCMRGSGFEQKAP